MIKGLSIETKSSTGFNFSDTWSKMLESVPGVSLLKSRAILKKYPTVNSLIKEYSLCQSEKDKIGLLSNIQVMPGINGSSAKPRNLGHQISKKIYHCFFSSDPSLIFS